MENKHNEIIIYENKQGKVEVQFNAEDESFWLTQEQISVLFKKDRTVITKHINKIFKEQELKEKSNVQKMHIANSDKPIKFYSLDVVLAVGYRTSSQQATKFRIWATSVLKNYLSKGFAINEKRVLEYKERLTDLTKTIKLLENTVNNQVKDLEEAKSLLKIISDYSYALTILDDYDYQKIKIKNITKKSAYILSYKESKKIIDEMKTEFTSELFGKEKDESFKSSISTIYQTFDGKELYPSIEEKSANLLYFIVKNHSFIDGNKRIGATLFLYFMNKNKFLYKENGAKRIADNALVAITLMIAESKPEEKETIIKVVVNLINGEN